MKDPNRPYTCIILFLVGLLLIAIPIVIPAFKEPFITWLDPHGVTADYANTTYNLFWLLTYLIGTIIGVILIGNSAIRLIRMCRKRKFRVELD